MNSPRETSPYCYVADLTRYIIPRFFFEIRDANDKKRPTLFTSNSIISMDVVNDDYDNVLLKLVSGLHTSVDDYFRDHIKTEYYRGFVFTIVMITEDRVATLGLMWPMVLRRMRLYRPETKLDFFLCLLAMYLENIPSGVLTKLHAERLNAILHHLRSRRYTSMAPLTELLFNGIEWLLNTLMYMNNLEPFAREFVLPHYDIIQPMLDVSNADIKPLLEALYYNHAHFETDFGANIPIRDIVIRHPSHVEFRPSDLNKLYSNKNLFKRLLYIWWHTDNPCDAKTMYAFQMP
ncbi:tegument protein [Psittacid alphaherpesvirus 5]|uniref:Tegument protein n=1 Tax=Psittacid alphaherpesvirus 5 TaxID=2972693 RepID=A0A5P9JTL9_9ALPH|nr:tegument protein [Psittacid alphaherpesvirus 5]QFU14595.1 tegument protein [Psittacid alphaherpesvirus 5]UOO01066.1 tegument protein [Psittacid alphaherpesvirus 5]